MIGLGVIAATRTVTGGGGGADPHFANVILLVHADTDFADTSPAARTVTNFGSTPISATAKFGAGSAEFAGGGTRRLAYAISGMEAGLALLDFTVEAQVLFTAANTNSPNVVGHFGPSGGWLLRASPTGINFLSSDSGGTNSRVQSSVGWSTGVWRHIAVTREGTTMRLFVDGVLATSASYAGSIDQTSGQALDIGGTSLFASTFTGLIDEVRVTRGVARYTANFTPPSAAFPDS